MPILWIIAGPICSLITKYTDKSNYLCNRGKFTLRKSISIDYTDYDEIKQLISELDKIQPEEQHKPISFINKFSQDDQKKLREDQIKEYEWINPRYIFDRKPTEEEEAIYGNYEANYYDSGCACGSFYKMKQKCHNMDYYKADRYKINCYKKGTKYYGDSYIINNQMIVTQEDIDRYNLENNYVDKDWHDHSDEDIKNADMGDMFGKSDDDDY
jgi:hypothetical protein